MKWHRYAPYILESSPCDGVYARMRIYQRLVKDSQAVYYTIHGQQNGVLVKLARAETWGAAMKLAEELNVPAS